MGGSEEAPRFVEVDVSPDGQRYLLDLFEGHRTLAALLRKRDLLSGRTVTYVPASIPREALNEFVHGVAVETAEWPEEAEWPIEWVSRRVCEECVRSGGVLVVQDPVAKPMHNSLARRKRPYTSFGEEIYPFGPAYPNYDAVFDTIDEARGAWAGLVAVVTSPTALADGQVVDRVQVEGRAKDATMIVAEAFDGLSFVVWTN